MKAYLNWGCKYEKCLKSGFGGLNTDVYPITLDKVNENINDTLILTYIHTYISLMTASVITSHIRQCSVMVKHKAKQVI